MTTEHDGDEVHPYSYPRERTSGRAQRANPASPAPAARSGILDKAALQAEELRFAINRLDGYLSNFGGIDGVEELLRPLCQHLNDRLADAEQRALLDKQRRERQPKMTLIKRPRGST